MGNTAIAPHHTATESTIVFDTFPLATQQALRVYSGTVAGSTSGAVGPFVCTATEYSDIFAAAQDVLSGPRYDCGCLPPPFALQERVLQQLRQEFSNLDLSIENRKGGDGFWWQYVLIIKRKGGQPSGPSDAASYATASYTTTTAAAAKVPDMASGNTTYAQFSTPKPSAPTWEQVAPTTTTGTHIPVVQAIPVDDR